MRAPLPKRPAVVTVFAILDFVLAAIALVPAVALALRPPELPVDAAFVAAAGAAALVSAGLVVAGSGLLHLEEYGRRAHACVSAFVLLLVPVGTLIGMLSLSYLAKRGTRVLFSGRPPTPDEFDDVQRASSHQEVFAAAVLGLVVAAAVLLAVAVALLATWILRW